MPDETDDIPPLELDAFLVNEEGEPAATTPGQSLPIPEQVPEDGDDELAAL